MTADDSQQSVRHGTSPRGVRARGTVPIGGRRVTVVASEVLGVPGTGGPGTADSLLAVALGRHGHEVELVVAPGRALGTLSAEWTRAYASAGVSVRPLEAKYRVRPQFLAPTLAVLDALRADPPDVVVVDDWRGLAWAALRSRQLGVGLVDTAFVLYCHGPARVLAEAAKKVPDTLARFGEEVAERACIELADVVVSPSEWLLGWMRAHGWPVPESARVVQNLWESAALGTHAVHVPTDSSVRRLAFFGQLREGKGILLLISALQRLEPRLLAGVELLFLGRESRRWTAERVREVLGGSLCDAIGSIRFESGLDRSGALEELCRPGTLVVLPSLLENSPYAVAECLERGIPFIATDVGGVSELVRERDRERVLVPPDAEALATALARALNASKPPAPALPARAPEESLDTWLRLVGEVAPRPPHRQTKAGRVAIVARGTGAERRARDLAGTTRDAEVTVIAAETRRAGLDQSDAEWVLFLDEDDLPNERLVDALLAAQAASCSDAVTTAVRPVDDPAGVLLFLGAPGALGLIENHYGVLGLVRRSLAAEVCLDGENDPDWLVFAQVALRGGTIVAYPDPLALHAGRPGSVGDVPGEGLAVLEAFERHGGKRLGDLVQLAATLAAVVVRAQSEQSALRVQQGVVARSASVLRDEGPAGVIRRVRLRLGLGTRSS